MVRSRDKNIQWSLKPIVVFMKILGIRIDILDKASLFSRLLIQIVFCIISTLMLVDSYAIFKDQKKHLQNNSVSTESPDASQGEKSAGLLFLNIMPITDALIVLHCCIPYLTLFIISISKTWSSLWLTLFKIEVDFNVNQKFYRKIRRYCYIGALLFFLVN